jgi:hypothetical protein
MQDLDKRRGNIIEFTRSWPVSAIGSSLLVLPAPPNDYLLDKAVARRETIPATLRHKDFRQTLTISSPFSRKSPADAECREGTGSGLFLRKEPNVRLATRERAGLARPGAPGHSSVDEQEEPLHRRRRNRCPKVIDPLGLYPHG